jgi:hypothetical protein
MITLTEMPAAIEKLPRDERGYPVPWFVAFIDGKPDFRCIGPGKRQAAIEQKLCWVCGEPLDPRQHVFVIGPMCAINQITSEPPNHESCAIFSVRNCPFLTKPKAQYRDAAMPEGSSPPVGLFLTRNPGVSCLWYCRGYSLLRVDNGILFKLPGAAMVRFWREGRKATREEILESIAGGLPVLEAAADLDGPAARLALRQAVDRAMKLIPASQIPASQRGTLPGAVAR